MRIRKADLVLMLVAFIWGGTFLTTQLALKQIGPFGYLALRFSVGAVALGLISFKTIRRLTKVELLAGAGIGVTLFVAYALQTIGLMYIASSKSAFITAIYVPLVPILLFLAFRRKPSLNACIGVAVSFAGLVFLSSHHGLALSFGLGEWLTLGSALTTAIPIILISEYASDTNPVRLAFVQLSVVAVLSLCVMPLAGEVMHPLSASLIWICLSMGIVATAFVLVAMNWAQRSVPATRATLIYAMEPVWAGVVGIVAGERMGMAGVVGSILIVAGVVIGELRARRTAVPITAKEAFLLDAAA